MYKEGKHNKMLFENISKKQVLRIFAAFHSFVFIIYKIANIHTSHSTLPFFRVERNFYRKSGEICVLLIQLSAFFLSLDLYISLYRNVPVL